jgi:hypothetical protein
MRGAWHRLTVAIIGSVVAASTLLPTSVSAVPPQPPEITIGDDPAAPQTVPSCTAASWASPVVKIHLPGFSGNQADMEDAIRDVNAQIGRVGGSTVRIESTVVSDEAFHTSPYYDSEPVIHVGFRPIANPKAAASAFNAYPCEHFITIDTAESWNYGLPADYYTAGKYDSDNSIYFRISYLHELMHAFGVGAHDEDGHPDNVYSFLNYGERPWVHASEDAMIRPLPYDVRELRDMFPGSGSRTEVAVTNTWLVHENPPCAPNLNKAVDADLSALCETDPVASVTYQEMLCAPSVGDEPKETKLFARFCGEPNATAVCPGSILQVHYGLANYSTASVSVTSNMWLSLDDAWDPDDYLSPTSKSYSVSAATSQNKFWGYEVPSLPINLLEPREYYVIVRATATTPSGVTVRDSIPMVGTVTDRRDCLSSAPAGPVNPQISAPGP